MYYKTPKYVTNSYVSLPPSPKQDLINSSFCFRKTLKYSNRSPPSILSSTPLLPFFIASSLSSSAMKKLYRKGTVHPSPPQKSDHLSFLPATILTLTVALSAEDREVLAYLISCSSSSNFSGNRRSTAARSASSNCVDHPPLFSCYCFRCYMSYWVRWDSSPNRQLIHEIIDAYEDGLHNKKEKSRKDRRRSRGSVNLGSSGELNRSELSPGNKEFTESENSVEEISPRSNGGNDIDDGEEDEEMGKGSMRRFVSFLGEKIWGVWA